jgi:hypothetical protein
MPLPELTDAGELPPGVHRASLQETLRRFGVGLPQRVAVGERLERIHAWPRQPDTWLDLSFLGRS